MRLFASIFLLLFSLAGKAQQHSDLYNAVDSMMADSLQFHPDIEKIRAGDSDENSVKKAFGQHQAESVWPQIILDGSLVYLPELDNINRSEISRITILRPAAAKAIFGSNAINGAVLLESITSTLKKRLAVLNNKDVSFFIDSTEVTIKKNVKNKFFWKQLIVSDPYFCEQITPQVNKGKGRIIIETCELPIHLYDYNGPGRNFRMKIAAHYVYSSREIKEYPLLGMAPPVIPKMYNVDLDMHSTYFYKVVKADQ
jgi:hypothetical protein